MSRHLLLSAICLGAASVSAQITNSQLDGFTFTNGLSSLSDTSGLLGGFDQSVGVAYLTDNQISTFSTQLGEAAGGAIQGLFAGPVSSSATGIYLVGLAPGGTVTFNGDFTVQLQLAGGLTAGTTYSDASFVVTSQSVPSFDFYRSSDGAVILNLAVATAKYAYLHMPFSDFGVTGNQVVGIRLSSFTSQYPDIGYIGAGYAGSPVPEPSTYGLILGGLALGAAALRRRRKA